MAKKTVATLHEGSKDGRAYTGHQDGEEPQDWCLHL